MTALVRDAATRAVALLEARCVRCGLCVAACHFGTMVPETDAPPAKCDLCGGAPRCVPFCPTAALEYLPAVATLQSVHTTRAQGLSPA